MQPCLVTRVPVKVEKGISLASVTAAEIADLSFGLPRIESGFLRQSSILSSFQCALGERPQVHESGTAVAPAGHVIAYLPVVTPVRAPSPPCPVPGLFREARQLIQALLDLDRQSGS